MHHVHTRQTGEEVHITHTHDPRTMRCTSYTRHTGEVHNCTSHTRQTGEEVLLTHTHDTRVKREESQTHTHYTRVRGHASHTHTTHRLGGVHITYIPCVSHDTGVRKYTSHTHNTQVRGCTYHIHTLSQTLYGKRL